MTPVRELTDKELDAVAAGGFVSIAPPGGDRLGFIRKVPADIELSVPPNRVKV